MVTSSIDTDTFTGFVEAIARNLGDGAVSANGFAAQAFLSRSHFDRVIRATAGEPPATFQRRVLLERAAYQLATSRTGILDVALEAGYSSHEAFVRAFRRAYGVNPSEWRQSPRQIKLPTPNDVHFHPPGGLRLPTKTEITSMDLITRMVEHHVWLVGEMLDRATRLSDAQLDQQIDISVEDVDESPTLRWLLSRLVGQMNMWNNVIRDEDYDFAIEEHESVGSMKKRFATVGPDFLGEIREVVGGGRLDETFIDAHCTPVEVYTYGGMIAHVLNFAAFRRTLVLGAFASAGITDLGYGDPRKWVAEAA
ncbi:MAG: AraC family transcriptional regulator [Chloroflexota bacterium]